MIALLAAWVGLASVVLAVAMLLYRPAMTDVTILLVLYFGAPGALCLGGLVLWSHRSDSSDISAVAGQRRQARTGIACGVIAAAIVYLLIIFSEKIVPVEG